MAIVGHSARIDPASLGLPDDIETRAFVPDLDQHLAACDLAIVQGGLSTCMELTAAGTPFIYFPLRHHFEQSFHVPYRLDRYGAGRRMDLDASGPVEISAAIAEEIAGRPRYNEVSTGGARRAAAKLAEML